MTPPPQPAAVRRAPAPAPVPAPAPGSAPASAPVPAPAAGPVRLGVHGAARPVEDLLARCGHGRDGVRLVPYTVADPFAPLRAGEADLMIVKYAPAEPDIAVSEPVAYDPRAALMRAGHPLAGHASVSLEDLGGYEVFDCPGDFPPSVWDEIVPRSTPRGRPLRRAHPMTTLAGAAAVMASSDAVHPSFASVAAALPPGIVAVPIADLEPAPVALAWLCGTPLAPAAAALVRDAEAAAAR